MQFLSLNNMPEMSSLEGGKIGFFRDFRGLGPWLLGPLPLGLVRKNVAEEVCGLNCSCDSREGGGERG